jgi:regulator of protease activity HflC (stomatin/prohibitin superfamily)
MTAAPKAKPDDRPALRAVPTDPDVVRENDGWRAGKPIEDPEKQKRWGFVTARPSEYLIHVRRGRIRRRSTGQGASCFKWPWDAVAIVPTTVNRLQFVADQVTRERVGVQVTGLAVYRIARPEIAFTMLNFSFAERASEKLSEIMREMFVGATRRHVANLTIDDVMTRRKEAIATELMRELDPVLRGRGRVDDETDRGWGVVLDSVEIQDVRVLSERVFADMQAEFRAELAARARAAELATAQDIAAREAASRRAIEEARVEADSATRRMRALAESEAAAIELEQQRRRDELQAEAERAAYLRDQARATERLEAEAAAEEAARRRAELAALAEVARRIELTTAMREQLRSEHETEALDAELATLRAVATAQAHAAQTELDAQLRARLRREELELERIAAELSQARAAAARAIENTISDDRIRLALVERALPKMAEALGHGLAGARFTHVGTSGDDPVAVLGGALESVLELGRSLTAPPPAEE